MNRQIEPDHHEIEWQFDALDLRPVERWLFQPDNRHSVQVSAGTIAEIRDAYFDTEDWRIHRAGFSLRLRSLGDHWEATLKARTPAVDGLRNRREITQLLASADPKQLATASGPVSSRVQSLVGSRPLGQIFELQTQRRTFDLGLPDGQSAELTFDYTTIPLGKESEPVRLSRVEIEADARAAERLEPFVADLRHDTALQPAGVSKFEAALLAHGLAIPDAEDLGVKAVNADMTIAEAGYATLRKHFTAFLRHEAGTRLGDDIEELHDMRVAARRLRAAIKLFAASLPPAFEKLGAELRWVASALGEVRDIDVQLEQLSGWRAELPESDRAALDALADALNQRRDAARVKMLAVLDSRRYERLVNSFSSTLRRGASARTGVGLEPALAIAPDLIARRYRSVRKQGDKITAGSPPDDYHELRIRFKRLRYALEFFAPLYGNAVQPAVKQMVAIQDLLGLHQDAYVAIEHLREMSTQDSPPLPGETIFVMGMVAHRYQVEAEQCRSRFPDLYDSVSSKRWQKLTRTMDRLRPDLDEKNETRAMTNS